MKLWLVCDFLNEMQIKKYMNEQYMNLCHRLKAMFPNSSEVLIGGGARLVSYVKPVSELPSALQLFLHFFLPVPYISHPGKHWLSLARFHLKEPFPGCIPNSTSGSRKTLSVVKQMS